LIISENNKNTKENFIFLDINYYIV